MIFKTAVALVNELLEDNRAGRITLLMRQLKRIDLLIPDELGYITLIWKELSYYFRSSATIRGTKYSNYNKFAVF